MTYQCPNLSHFDVLKQNPSRHLAATDKPQRVNLIAVILAAVWIVAAFAYAVTSPLFTTETSPLFTTDVFTAGTAQRE